MAARRQQRLVNLVLALLSTRQFVTAERIRDTVEGYRVADDATNPDEAFKRSFERDKAELRDLGIPLETGRNSAFDTEDGYRIARSDFELPPIDFTADEAAAVGLAARLWSTASLASEARTALIKLRAAGVEIEPPRATEFLSPLAVGEPALPTLMAAVSEHRVVQFEHRKPTDEQTQKRTVEAWGVLSWRGRWYVVGYDRGRGAVRSFRLDRIVGAVRTVSTPATAPRPDDLDMVGLVRGYNEQQYRLATVRVRSGGAGQLHRLARSAEPDPQYPEHELLEVDYRDTGWLAGVIAAAGADAVALAPVELVDTVVSLLRGAASAPSAVASAPSGVASAPSGLLSDFPPGVEEGPR